MNYDNQIALTEKQLIKLQQDSIGKGYSIDTIHNYPKNRKHLEAYLSFETGFSITRNMDGYIFEYVDGEAVLQPENKWVVMAYGDNSMFKYNKVFDKVKDAVKYAYLTKLNEVSKDVVRLNRLISKL